MLAILPRLSCLAIGKAYVDDPSGKVCFPIFSKDSPKAQKRIKEVTQGIPTNAFAIIESMQPYYYLSAYPMSHLWKLHGLWNIVKHQHIGAASRITSIEFPRVLPEAKFEAIDNGYIVRFPLSAKPQVSFNPMPPVSIDIEFGDRRKGLIVTIPDLGDMYQHITNSVISKFERFFPVKG